MRLGTHVDPNNKPIINNTKQTLRNRVEGLKIQETKLGTSNYLLNCIVTRRKYQRIPLPSG